MRTLAEDFAAHVTARASGPLSQAAASEAKTLLMDYLAVAVRGSQEPAATIVADFSLRYGAKPSEATMVGRGYRVTAQAAAYANAVAAHSLELDDVDANSFLHFGAPVVSATLAAGEASGASGMRVLTAIVTGCEVMQALSEAANPGLRDRGFHGTAVCGVFGAVAAASQLLDLSHSELVSALGLAGAHASGLFEVYGPTMQKRIQPGPAASHGITCARLAAMGITGTSDILDGRSGFLNAFTSMGSREAAIESLARGAPLGIELKPYACVRPLHSAIDAALQIRQAQGFSPEAVTSIRVSRSPAWDSYHLVRRPRASNEAQGSLSYAVAVALVDGAALIEQFADDRLADPALQRLAHLVEIDTAPDLPRSDSCIVQVTLNDGATIQARVDYPLGSPERPLTEADRAAKLHYLADSLLGESRVDKLQAIVSSLEVCENVVELMENTVGVPNRLDVGAARAAESTRMEG